MQDILVVDDEEVVRNLIKGILEYAGYEVRVARNGKEATSLLELGVPDLLITDLSMPEKPGNMLIEEVRTNQPAIPIIAISGAPTLQPGIYLRIAKSLGADYIMAKPFSTADLLRTVRRALSKKEAVIG
ncbi:MAG: response regulator [Acidobacteria bacterium]|nr:response regulator [Acidobacteriota bacterium]